MAKPIRRSLARRLGRNIGDRRRAVGLTQEQLAEYLEIDTLTVSRYETGTILPPLTVVDVVARLLNTTIADLLGEAPVQPVEHADRIGIWLASLPLSDRDWIERVVKQLVERCQPRKRGRPRTRPKADKVPPPSPSA
ncbi:helix-turn-helix domain-containing protein [Verminephrobacter eiseniae]|uniref:helix-turn-helix domain-containing protein n=1 Tax=Verminephrobacter eiseniae TaxID=364317 RepID=UPI0022371D36|nr:helix-turn-helix transcriptional regulator [Verminephrobacter eiseniae]MCW5230337.1 XRE family transcriptional regulator [Verminephrobacter eiseniae]MCW5292070.1 XRE family transcriptional regulator [Verminephrobacter eiseniae]MCW8185350.1 XRE family transcriptional regulator [Verminephrobacter eiseniae]MCW8223999.1 XRE family transcriptional regulator [Verminephrobacter eiseniae]MCW8233576.1 XRE family transcriptional regulator [Verminephrobacter eiseniae]